MRTLAIVANDLALNAFGNIVIADSLDTVEQRIVRRLNWAKGEWFLDVTGGVPYLEEVFVRPASLAVIALVLSSRIRPIDDVIGVEVPESSIDEESRKFAMTIIVRTTFGRTTLKLSGPANSSSGLMLNTSFAQGN